MQLRDSVNSLPIQGEHVDDSEAAFPLVWTVELGPVDSIDPVDSIAKTIILLRVILEFKKLFH